MREPSAAAVAEGSACVTELAKGVEVIRGLPRAILSPAPPTCFCRRWRTHPAKIAAFIQLKHPVVMPRDDAMPMEG